MFQSIISNFEIHTRRIHFTSAGTDPGLFLGGGALVSCSTSTSLNHIVFFFWQNTSCIRKPAGHLGGGGVRALCTLPLDPPLLRDSESLLIAVVHALQLVQLEHFVIIDGKFFNAREEQISWFSFRTRKLSM